MKPKSGTPSMAQFRKLEARVDKIGGINLIMKSFRTAVDSLTVANRLLKNDFKALSIRHEKLKKRFEQYVYDKERAKQAKRQKENRN